MKILYLCDKEKKKEVCNMKGCRQNLCNHTSQKEYSLNWKEKDPTPNDLLTRFYINGTIDDDFVMVERDE